MAPPTRPPEAGIDAPPAALADAAPEQQLTGALACFQAEVSPITAADLAEVVHSARPAFRSGISWSARLREQQGRSRLQVTVMHIAGAELCSECWADEASDLAETTALMLAMLLGIPVTRQARAVQPETTENKEANAKPPADDPQLLALTEAEISTLHQQILELPQAARQQLTKAFREHFGVPRNARSIGDRITQRQHSDFIALFLDEAHGQVQLEAPAEPGP